jgi:hypothetical protein
MMSSGSKDRGAQIAVSLPIAVFCLTNGAGRHGHPREWRMTSFEPASKVPQGVQEP